jgi:CubicO group peptidase (beta-lactamase class C family)
MIRALFGAVLLFAATESAAAEPEGLHQALERLAGEGRFSGAVVIRDSEGEIFSRGYGLADPFTSRPFAPTTLADSGSLAKPVTAAIALSLAEEKRIDLDAPVERYLPQFAWNGVTVRHLLAHSAGLIVDESEQALVGKTNAQLVAEGIRRPRAFAPGASFAYCTVCYSALALLIEQVAERRYLELARDHAALPLDIALRPPRLADWTDRAIGYRTVDGRPRRADSYENERFYGSANLSVSAKQLAQWGEQWWNGRLASIVEVATEPARIAGHPSGLSWGNWYCAPDRRRCHYLGHHEGFHHMLYWDRDRRLSVAMVSNNSLAPGLQQRLQRALVRFAEGRQAEAQRELAEPLGDVPIAAGRYGVMEEVEVAAKSPPVIRRGGLAYTAFPIGSGVHYAPGLDLYLAGASGGRIRLLGLYEDRLGTRK